MILHNSNALWLLSATPVWYFSTIANPLGLGPFSFIPFLGILGLIGGVLIGVVQREWALLRPLSVVVLSFLASELYVAIAGYFRGQLPGNAAQRPEYLFSLAQLALTVYLIYRERRTLLVSLALSTFCLSYGLFALFVGAMAFADSWL